MFMNEVIGGILIGLASALPLLFDGRIAGVSGYAASLLSANSAEKRTGAFFVLGLLLAGLAWNQIGGNPSSASNPDGRLALWAVGGLLVGFGSRLGGGCTSGHGVCGLGRLSPRSLVSVVLFIATAVLVTFIKRSFV
jgi:uncharacterized membrane protein YedE/YeeE